MQDFRWLHSKIGMQLLVQNLGLIYALCITLFYCLIMVDAITMQGPQRIELSMESLLADLDQIRTGIAIYDAEFNLVFANKRVRSYLPYLYTALDTGSTLLEGIESQVTMSSPNDDPETRKNRALEIFEVIKKSGTMLVNTPVGIRLKSTYSETKTGGYILTTTDVTDHVNYEDELAKSRDEAKRASQIKTQFLANMTHEIRTPMSGVFMAAQLLRQEIQRLNQPKLLELAEILTGSAEHLSGIINDVLVLSKIEAGHVEIAPQNGSLADTLRVLMQAQKLVATDSGIQLKLAIDPSVPTGLSFDPLRVRQCVTNLVTNALKFTSAGSVTVAVLYDPETSLVTIHVADTGIGIAPFACEKIFGQFGQVTTELNQVSTGSGLGLPISRNLARLMGGDIRVKSKVGKGSVFTFTFKSKRVANFNIADVKAA